MAAAASVSALTEELITAIAKPPDDGRDTLHFRILKRRTEDTFKLHAHTRTDQFAVANQLEGLQEKFQVLNRDELADALRIRLTELDEHRSSWFPEILSLLLQLADRPAQLSKVDEVAKVKPGQEVKPLTWTDLDTNGSAYRGEDIWESVDFGADSSDDDLSSESTGSYHARNQTQTSIDPEDDYVIPEELFTSGQDDDLMDLIRRAQFWSDANNTSVVHQGEPSSRIITELQVIRETVFMLQGLPTSLFWRLDGRIEIDRRYTVADLSNETILSLLRSLSLIGSKLDVLRQFNKVPQKIPYMQTFHRGIESHLSRFDLFLSNVQLRYLSRTSTVSTSLLELREDVRRDSRLLLMLSELVSSVESDTSGSSIRSLDSMYDLACLAQATGDDEFMPLAELFFSCFETYSRPIRLWMETGQLETSPGSELFIAEERSHGDLRTLWHDWYTADTASRLLEIPKFIQPIAHKIFITGKSMVFLRRLNMSENKETTRKTSLTFEEVLPPGPASLCLPFSALLETAFRRMVEKSHSYMSALLRKELDQQCGLWRSLEALEYIYLCKDMSIFGPIDSKVFDLIDRGKGVWSDRFLLTELAQSSFDTLPLIDPSRLIVRTSEDARVDTNNRSRSVKILNAISFDYILPWPVANIITKDSILGYQRISTFLMQIRRAKQTIVKQRLQHNDHSDKIQDTRNNSLSYALRHNMLWFLNALYGHMMDFVASTATESLRKSLSAAADVDAMIAAHRSYMSSLEEQCLLSTNLHPLHQAIITILDLCVCFADVQTSRYGENYLDHGRTASKSAKSFNHRAAYGDDDPSDEEDDDSDIDDEKLAASFHETHYLQRVRDIKDQFDRLIAFMVAGLRGVGRVDGQVSWEILAEKLEWRKKAGG
ncbi:hypothetical protein BO71DRAFT_373457 [Aspergillus ellipticus CBS 707.79]|uniref:Spindle pole body component n=1 Tax=Aspergillus ellipticus CBS 707.79 TaxID=1448320 RepID=A0A319DIR5_9EURO|nr:hypothetical protein BO71DRAFT_373457 [Aspergillus ellipticus CBS 707.79]